MIKNDLDKFYAVLYPGLVFLPEGVEGGVGHVA